MALHNKRVMQAFQDSRLTKGKERRKNIQEQGKDLAKIEERIKLIEQHNSKHNNNHLLSSGFVPSIGSNVVHVSILS